MRRCYQSVGTMAAKGTAVDVRLEGKHAFVTGAAVDVAQEMQELRAGELVLEPLVVEHAEAMFAVLREPAL
jgi:hypothetical protein